MLQPPPPVGEPAILPRRNHTLRTHHWRRATVVEDGVTGFQRPLRLHCRRRRHWRAVTSGTRTPPDEGRKAASRFRARTGSMRRVDSASPGLGSGARQHWKKTRTPEQPPLHLPPPPPRHSQQQPHLRRVDETFGQLNTSKERRGSSTVGYEIQKLGRLHSAAAARLIPRPFPLCPRASLTPPSFLHSHSYSSCSYLLYELPAPDRSRLWRPQAGEAAAVRYEWRPVAESEAEEREQSQRKCGKLLALGKGIAWVLSLGSALHCCDQQGRRKGRIG